MYRVEGRRRFLSAIENGGKSFNKKMQYFTICDEENPDYRINELICYCFLTNLGIKFLVHILNYLIKKRIVDTVQGFCSNLSQSN